MVGWWVGLLVKRLAGQLTANRRQIALARALARGIALVQLGIAHTSADLNTKTLHNTVKYECFGENILIVRVPCRSWWRGRRGAFHIPHESNFRSQKLKNDNQP